MNNEQRAYIDQLEDSLDYALETILISEQVLSDDTQGARTRIKTVLQDSNLFIKDMIQLGYLRGGTCNEH